MLYRTITLWTIANQMEHPELILSDKTSTALEPLFQTLFPGIQYGSADNLNHITREYLIPAIQKLYPELRHMSPANFNRTSMSYVPEFLPCQAFEWRNNPKWEQRFYARLFDDR